MNMRHLRTTFTVIGAVTVLVLAANTVVFAATGGNFILGHTNKANKVSTLKRTTSGPALNLVTTSSSNAPLSTNGHGRVANLNADKVDGYHASSLLNGTYVFTKSVTTPNDFVDIRINLPAGLYNLTYAAYLVNGGTDTGSAGCYFYREVNGSNDTYYGESVQLTKSSVYPSLTGSATISFGGSGVTVNLYCYAPANFTTIGSEPIQITAQRTSRLTAGGSLARVTAPGARVTTH